MRRCLFEPRRGWTCRAAAAAIALVAIPLTISAVTPAPSALRVERLRTDGREDPIGLGHRVPRFSWQLRSEARGVRQSAWQVRVAASVADLKRGRPLVWDSGRVASEESILRPYGGPALVSGRRYVWQVQVWGGAGAASGWSAPASFEIGLLEPTDWKASWIEPGLKEESGAQPSPMLRRAFALTRAVRSARAYVTSHGLYELYLNGARVGDEVLTPGWTSYATRLQYQTYDVTSLLRRGPNVAGAILGSGWYRGNIGFSGKRGHYGDTLALLAQIVVTYADGSVETIGTDAGWKAATGPILMSEIYHGETYDARLEPEGWDTPAFDDSRWAPVRVAQFGRDNLVAPEGPPVRRVEEVKAKAILKTPSGLTVVDMGQNMVGWLRLTVRGPAGTTVTLRLAEVLDKSGEFYTANLRSAKQTVTYTLRGGRTETYEPHFTFQGFRYVAVAGYPGELTLDSLTGVVVHSAMATAGEFSASMPQLNQLQHNIRWGQKGNFVDVPTDCPQRDERLGWTGDAQAFARTAAFNADVSGFFTKWLKDVAADQLPNGSVPFVVPDVLSAKDRPAAGSAGWGDAAVIIPWTMYLTYGDPKFLADQYDSMVKWVGFMRDRAGDDFVWSGDFHFGDWLAFATTRSDYPGATTSKDLIATAFYAHATDLLARSARVLGKTEDAATYARQLERIKAAFVNEFVTPAGRVGEATQTAYVLALQFDLLPEGMRANAAGRLAAEIRERKHLTTGFLGTPYLCHVLSRYGYLDEAYMLLERQEYPSWLYPVTKGATTIWERWDGIKPDGSFQDEGMNSFNHYAYGAIGEWMYGVMAGLEIDEAAPGYKHFFVQPRPGGTITAASATHETPYGAARSAWTLGGGRFELAVDVPPNTTATVRLPGATLAAVTEGGRPLDGLDGIASARQDGRDVVVAVGSGHYGFAFAR
jgi:alpha-L-rhamnosidase